MSVDESIYRDEPINLQDNIIEYILPQNFKDLEEIELQLTDEDFKSE